MLMTPAMCPCDSHDNQFPVECRVGLEWQVKRNSVTLLRDTLRDNRMPESHTVPLSSLADTQQLARFVADASQPPLTIGLVGSLGAGKTQWVRFLVDQWGVPAEQVTSPTYVLLQQYVGRFRIYHFDFYRLESEAQVWDLGIEELYEQPVIVLVEWADKFPTCLPPDRLMLQLKLGPLGQRAAQFASFGDHAAHIAEQALARYNS